LLKIERDATFARGNRFANYVPQAGKQFQEQRNGTGAHRAGAVACDCPPMRVKRLNDYEPLFFSIVLC
jgi:hypothetical protein